MEFRMQNSRLYVGNLSYSTATRELEELFSAHGETKEVNIIEGKGFGFVEMASPADAQKAKEALDGYEFQGRTLKVDEARPRRDNDSRDSRGSRRY
jgi:RNA recognition motif-containing protein